MAYGNTFPMSYQPMYYQQYQQPIQQPVQQNTQQVQNGGFVRVQNEAEARNYLVAQGTSVTFRDESAPYIYTKTMGFSPLDPPVFEKYKLVKEDAQNAEKSVDDVEYVKMETFANFQNDFEHIKKQVEKLMKEVNNEQSD
jgi:hypothetical protein